MKILYALHSYKPAYRVGGPILSVSAIAERLVKRGHEVTVFASNSNLDEDLDVECGRPVCLNSVQVWYFRRKDPLKRWLPFIPYFSKSMGFLYTPGMKVELARLLPTLDCVHTHLPFVYPSYAAAKAAINHRKPLFYHQRGVFDPERLHFRGLKKRLYIEIIEKPIMNKATTLIALTEAERESFRRLAIGTHCEILPNGIDCNLHKTSPEPGSLQRLGIKDSNFVILFLGRLQPIKGADLLLEAFLKISRDFPEAVLVLAGPDEFRIEARFKKKAHESGLSDRIIFPGMVQGNEKINLLARADVFCLPSVGEGFSMAILEAMASGKPVMISPGCHFPEVARHNAGWIVERNIGKWTAMLTSALACPDDVRVRGRAALNLVRTSYSWDSIVERLEAVYAEGITREKASRAMGRG
jgi:glycosyltransferase involved in cell wall biosynthesis